MFILFFGIKNGYSHTTNWFSTYNKLFYLTGYPKNKIEVVKNTIKYSGAI